MAAKAEEKIAEEKIAEEKIAELDRSLLDDDNFITQYTSLFIGRSGGYPEYKYCIALVILAIATARRCFMRFNFGTVFTNIWLLVIGVSGSAGKSTAFSEGRRLIEDVIGQVVLADMFSKEAIPQALSLNPCQSLINEEVAGMIDSIHRKGSYLAGLADEMCKFYDSPRHYVKQTTKETYEINDMFVNCLWCTTGSRFAESMSKTELEGGLFARFLFCVDNNNTPPVYIPAAHATYDADRAYAELENRLRSILATLNSFSSIEFILSDVAMAKYNAWYESIIAKDGNDFEKMILARMRIYIFKLCVLYYLGSSEFLSDAQKEKEEIAARLNKNSYLTGTGIMPAISLSVPDKYMDIAITHVTDYFMPSSVKLYNDVIQSNADSTILQILNALKEADNHTMTKTQIMHKLSGRVPSLEVDTILEDCANEELVEIKTYDSRNGRSKKVIKFLKMPDRMNPCQVG